MEILDVVDETGAPTGETVERAEAHREGVRHRTSHVWIARNRNGRIQLLLQKRCMQKDSFPGCYDISSAGHIPAGGEFASSALRELKEELGITFIYITHDQEEALTMSDKIIVMNKGYIQQMGTPEDIYNEPENAFVADFIGDSNIIDGIMLEDRLVEILGTKFPCVDEGFGKNRPVDVVIRPEDVVLKGEGEGIIDGIVTSLIFKGVHYEMEVEANGYEWLVHSTNCYPVGSRVSISVIPFNIQIMHKPESEDEKAVVVDE